MSHSIPAPLLPASAVPSRGRAFGVVALCALAYLYVFPYSPALNNPNENVRVYMSAALVEDGAYTINGMRERWGWVNDAAVKDGQVYSVKAPGSSFLGALGYGVFYLSRGGEVGAEDFGEALWATRFSGTIAPMLLFLFFLYRWFGAQTRSPFLRDAAFFSIAIGSSFFAYSMLFMSHATSGACAFGAFMLLYDARRDPEAPTALRTFLAGLLVAGVTFFEYPGFILSLCLSVYALLVIRPRARLLPFALGGLIPTLLVMHFQWSAFGNPFTPGHHYVEFEAFRAGHEKGFFGATGFHPDAAVTLLFDLRMGLLSMTPFFFLAGWGFVKLLARGGRDRLDGAVALAACSLLYLFICFMSIWSGGWAIGPRYLMPLVPFVGWAALRGWAPLLEKYPVLCRVLITALVIDGLVASGIPSMYFPHLPGYVFRPLGQFFLPLIRDGFAPLNAGQFFGVYGSASMLPMAALMIGAVWMMLEEKDLKRRAIFLLAGGAVAAALLAPQMWILPHGEKVRRFSATTTSGWFPGGHDRAARLEASLQKNGADAADVQRLITLYDRQGRAEDVARIRARYGAR